MMRTRLCVLAGMPLNAKGGFMPAPSHVYFDGIEPFAGNAVLVICSPAPAKDVLPTTATNIVNATLLKYFSWKPFISNSYESRMLPIADRQVNFDPCSCREHMMCPLPRANDLSASQARSGI